MEYLSLGSRITAGFPQVRARCLYIQSESDLIVPALAIIASNPDGIPTSDLSKLLRAQLKPSGDDLTLLAGRSDDKFSQKVRNLRSRETLERKGLAIFADGKFVITEAGKSLAGDGSDIVRSLKAQGFTDSERQSALDRNYDGIVIEEGERTILNRSVARRSSVLKRVARHITSVSNDPTHAERRARYRAKQNARFAELEAEVKRAIVLIW